MDKSEYKAKLINLFLLAGVAESILFPVIHVIFTKFDLGPEPADISALISLLFITGILLIYASFGAIGIEKILSSSARFWLSQIFFLILLFSASVITVFPGSEERYWFGYGLEIVILSLFTIPLLIAIFYKSCPKLDLFLSILIYSFVLIFYVPSIIQPPWGVIDWGHSLYIVNEILAPQNRNFPLINFSAQYTSTLGYLFNFLFHSQGTIDQAVWFLTLLAFSTIIIALVPVLRAFPKEKKYLAVIFTIPAIFIVKLHEDSYSGSLSALFSSIPIRLIFPSVLVFFFTTRLFRQRAITGTSIAGIICTFAILNNVESGIVSTIATLFVIILFNKSKNWTYLATLFCFSIFVSFIFIQLSLLLTIGKINLPTLFDFVGGFSGGFGAVAMPHFGLWVFAFVFLSMATIISALHIHKTGHKQEIQVDKNLWRASVIALFWGLFGIGMSPYYINRSVVSGQLQYILFSVFLSSSGLFLLIALSYGRVAMRNMVLIIAFLPGAISTASLIQHPSFYLAKNRLLRADSAVSEFYKIPIAEMRESISQIREKNSEYKIGLLSDFGSIYSGPLSIPSYLPVNNQFDLNIIKRPLLQQVCSALKHDKINFLITTGLKSDPLKTIENCGYVLYLTKSNHQIYSNVEFSATNSK